MVNLAGLLVGPLAGPECRRSVTRGWLIVVRGIAGVVILGVVLLALWIWYINQRLDAYYQPFLEIRIGRAVVEGMLLTLALVMGPAVLAGSLAGERERGALGLLLTTRVSPREIVSGRLAGKLSQLGMVMLAGVPAVVGLATLGGCAPTRIGLDLMLPIAVGFGAGGIAVLASSVSRRGRDALLAVYLFEMFLMMTPLLGPLGLSTPSLGWLSSANPYVGLDGLVIRDQTGAAWVSIGLWLAMGVVGAALASWRLRPACLAPVGGERVARGPGRRWLVPEVDEKRPMIWKERYIERVGTLGKFGRWAGSLIMIGLIGGSVTVFAVIAWDGSRSSDSEWTLWAIEALRAVVDSTGLFLIWLLEWSIGLRASVSIASERERGTWDALLTSPLEGVEIVRGKLWGSLHAPRGLIVAALLAWTIAAAVRAIPIYQAVDMGAAVLVVGAFMAAVGVRTSLACQTATRAMTWTIGIWLLALIAVRVCAFIALTSGILVGSVVLSTIAELGLAPPQSGLWMPIRWYVAWPLANNVIYILATLIIVADTGFRFDRLAGRSTGGKVGVALERLMYGPPVEPLAIVEKVQVTG